MFLRLLFFHSQECNRLRDIGGKIAFEPSRHYYSNIRQCFKRHVLVKNVTAPENESIRGLKTGLLNHIRFQPYHSLKLALKENCYLDIEFSSNVVYCCLKLRTVGPFKKI